MGREVEAAISRLGHKVAVIVDPGDPDAQLRNVWDALGRAGTEAGPEAAAGHDAEGYIDFSVPESGLPNALAYLRAGATAVIGTTGWDSTELVRAQEESGSSSARILWGANFSTGAQAFFRLVSEAARLLSQTGAYDPGIVELHHRGKADRPSGTAIRAAEALLASWPRKSRIHRGDAAPDADALEVSSVRIGRVHGIHELRLDSAADEIRIVHEAHGRSGFAEGAVNALQWLSGQAPGLYRAEDYFDSLFSPVNPA